MTSGWAVMGDVQFLPGYSLLLPDPVVPSLNDLGADERARFLSEMTLIGDALLEVTRASRINYEILGNAEPELHAHIFPRYRDEPDHLIRRPAWFYDWKTAPQFSEENHGPLKQRITEAIQKRIRPSL
jgi:diadenosine tetraphosphate (Ap4A) HIT family hydrolase